MSTYGQRLRVLWLLAWRLSALQAAIGFGLVLLGGARAAENPWLMLVFVLSSFFVLGPMAIESMLAKRFRGFALRVVDLPAGDAPGAK